MTFIFFKNFPFIIISSFFLFSSQYLIKIPIIKKNDGLLLLCLVLVVEIGETDYNMIDLLFFTSICSIKYVYVH